MNRELFGVFGDEEAFTDHRRPSEFDEVVRGDVATVGIRDPGLGTFGWSASHEGEDGSCLIWGENYPEEGENGARWFLERYAAEGRAAFDALNGSYLVFVEHEDEALVATDPVRSCECFYTDDGEVRLFGTDAATVARTIDDPTLRLPAVLEYLHAGVTLGEKTSIERLRRVRADTVLRPDGIEPLQRFVYEPREFDYVAELADRLERAIRRRAQLPGRKGLLLSAGYDSRTLLSGISGIEHCYTVGDPASQEVRSAKRLAHQYGARHTAFPPDHRYLLADDRKVRYSQGIKESLHIHHAGYTDAIDVDTIYHGLLADTFFRGHFTGEDDIELFGKRIPLYRTDPDPEPVSVLLSKFGYDREASRQLSAHIDGGTDDPDEFVRDAVRTELEASASRVDSIQNQLNCCGITNQPSLPFHVQLADNYFSSFLAVDRELLDWHLATPPEHRTTETFLAACERIDPGMLRHEPPDRPRSHRALNDVEGFLRRKTPFLRSFEPPWPDRETLFEVYELDRRLLPDHEHLYDLPGRHKLRIHDVLGWLGQSSEPTERALEALLEPDAGRVRRPSDDRSAI